MMPHQTDRLSYKSPRIVCSTLILHCAVALLLLTHEAQATGQPQPIVALVGTNITLPCHVKPATDAVNEMVEWARSDLLPRFVHVRRSGDDLLVDQNPSYKGRTSVSVDGLKQGDASLTLSRVALSDNGTYRCFIPQLNTDSSVQLVVDDVVTDPSGSGSTAPIIIGLVAGVVLILAVAFAVWKWRQNKTKTKKQQEDEETQRGEKKSQHSEQECLIERETDREQLEKERETINNQNKMEENNIVCLGEGTKRSYQTEEETHHEKTEGETSSILTQRQELCINAKTEEGNKSTTVETAAPGSAEVETQNKEPAERTKSVNTETATQSLKDGHGRQQQVRADADANNDAEKEEKEEDIKSTEEIASSQGPTDDKRHSDPPAGGGVLDDSDQTGGQTGRSDHTPVPAERKRQQVRAAGESSNDTNTVENEDQTQTTENKAQGPTDDTTQLSGPPAGGGKQNPTSPPPVKPDRLSKSEGEQKDLNKLVRQKASNDTKTVENKTQTQTKENKVAAQGPTDDTTQHGDPTAGGETNVTEEKDTPCPAERRQVVKNGERRDGGGNTTSPPVKPDRLSVAERQKDFNKKNEDNKTESTNNKAAGSTDGETQQNDRPAVGETMNELDQTGGQTGKSDDTPVPAERKRWKEQQEESGKSLMEGDGQQRLVGQEESSDTKTVENEIQTQTKKNKEAAQSPTDETTQHSDPPAGGETKVPEEKDIKTESTNNKAPGPAEGETQQNDQPAVGETNNTLDQTDRLTGKRLTGEDSPCPTEKQGQQVKNEDSKDGGENATRLSSVLNQIHKTEEQRQSDQPQAKVESDVAKKEKETDKTGLPQQTEGETHVDHSVKEQPEKQEEGDGEEGKVNII